MENMSAENNSENQLFDMAGVEQLVTTSKWVRFIGVVYWILAAIILSIVLFLLLNFDRIASEIIALGGMSDEMLSALETFGKPAIATLMFISAGIVIIIGTVLFRFGSNGLRYNATRQHYFLFGSLNSLKNYLLISFILGIISTIFSLFSTIAFFIMSQ